MAERLINLDAVFEVPQDLDMDMFVDKMIELVEGAGWHMSGGFRELTGDEDDEFEVTGPVYLRRADNYLNRGTVDQFTRIPEIAAWFRRLADRLEEKHHSA